MLMVGLLMVLASFSYAIIIINDPRIFFPFADEHGEMVSLKPDFGWSWYLNLITGIVTCMLAVVVLFVNFIWPRKAAVFFHHSVVEEDEFFQVKISLNVAGMQTIPRNSQVNTKELRHCFTPIFISL